MKDKLREDRHDAIAKAIADAIGHGMREKCERHADAVLAILDAEGVAVPIGYADPRSIQGYTLGQYGDFRVSDQSKLCSVPLYDHTHPARSGVVSDEDVEAAIDAHNHAIYRNGNNRKFAMRAALEHFAKGERHER